MPDSILPGGRCVDEAEGAGAGWDTRGQAGRVLGAGRCGSTLRDRILGQLDGRFATGQLADFGHTHLHCGH